MHAPVRGAGRSVVREGPRSDLAHHVERYHLPVAARFVEYARLRGWSAPALCEADLMRLAYALDGAEGTGAGE